MPFGLQRSEKGLKSREDPSNQPLFLVYDAFTVSNSFTSVPVFVEKTRECWEFIP